MRPFALASLAGIALFAGSLCSALAQSGTLQPPPAHAQPEATPKPPSAAPRQPVQQIGKTTPVVKPHGPAHAEKPHGATKPPATAAKPPAKPGEPPAAAVPAPLVVPAEPAKPAEAEKADPSAPKLPRFAALRSDEVNLRAGPGSRYPIEWVYRRRDLPVEILREFEVWRLIRDIDGIRGWVHQATLTGRRNFIVQGNDATLRDSAKDAGAAVALLKSGVVGRIRSCDAVSEWCQVQVAGYRGYLRRDQVWGLLPNEAVNP